MIKKISWQQASAILAMIVLAVGGATYTDLFGVLFQLKGIDYNYTGDITCRTDCESYIDLTTSYWRICFADYNETKYENETLFKKVSRSRTLHVNMDNIENVITTQRKLYNGSWEPYQIEVDWMVPARGAGNWRPIKDGDCWERKKINKIKLVGHKEPTETIKWSMGLEDYVDIDPIWNGVPSIGLNYMEIGTKNENCNGWHIEFDHVRKGTTEQVFNISIQNLYPTKRNINLTQVLEPLSYDMTEANMTLYEWKGIPTIIPTYNYVNVTIEQNCTDDNITYYDCSYNTTNKMQNGTEEVIILQWKPAKAQGFKNKTTYEIRENMELINIPKYGSKYKESDGTVNGTKYFQVRIPTVFDVTNNGWGSSGLYYIETDGCIFYDAENSSWWNDTWYNRKNVTVDGVGLSMWDNYQTRITIAYESAMQADFDDLRFTYYNSTSETETEIDYFLESKTNSDTARVYVEIPEISNSENITIYMYYNNSAVASASNASATLGEGIVSMYQMTGNANDSVGSNDGSLVGTPAAANDKDGNANQAYYFDGGTGSTAKRMDVSDDSSIDFTSEVSYGGWIKINYYSDATNARCAINKAVVGSSGYMMYYSSTAAKIYCFVYGISDTMTISNVTIPWGEYHHYMCVYDGSHLMVYQDGVQVAKDASTGSIATNDNTLYLNYYLTGNVYGKQIHDEIRLYNEGLTHAQINSMYTATEPTVYFGVEENVSINDTTAPVYSLNSTDSTVAGTDILHSLKWTDETGLNGYIFSFDNGTGSFTNDSFVTFTGTANYSNVSKYVNETLGSTIQWIVYANDTSDNWNMSLTYSYVTTCSVNADCNLCYKCVDGSCVVQTDAEDLKDECSVSYDDCSNQYTRTGPDGLCDGAGACGIDGASTAVATGDVCKDGTNINPNGNSNCGSGDAESCSCGTWRDCTLDNCFANNYYTGFSSGACTATGWVDQGTNWNVANNYIIDTTENVASCSVTNTGKSASYDDCSNQYTRIGPDGYCDGSGSLDTNDASLAVASGYVCKDGANTTVSGDSNCGTGDAEDCYCAIWYECIADACVKPEYYTGFDGNVNCIITNWQSKGTDANVAANVTIATTENVSSCTENTTNYCGLVQCDGDASIPYYHGWDATSTCFYKNDTQGYCDGAGSCDSHAYSCPGSVVDGSTGVTCELDIFETGCTGTTIGSCEEGVDFNLTESTGCAFYFYAYQPIQSEIEPYGQTSIKGMFSIDNNLSYIIDIYAKLNETTTGVTLKLDENYSYTDSVSITSSYQLIYNNLAIDGTGYLWAWADFNNLLVPWYPELKIIGVKA